MQTTIRGVILDLDGTLFDSEVGWQWFVELLRKRRFNVSPTDELCLRAMSHQQNFWEALQAYWPMLGVPGVEREWKSRNTMEAMPLFRGVREMLYAIHKMGVRLAVFSARDRVTAISQLQKQEILEYFQIIFTQEEFSPHQKADAESLLMLLRIFVSRFKITPSEILYAGDTPEVDGRVSILVGMPHFYGIARTDEKRQQFLSEGITDERIVECVTLIPPIQKLIAQAA